MPYPFSFCLGSVLDEVLDVTPLRKTISPSSFTPTNCNCFSASGGLAVSVAVRSIVSDSFQEQVIFQELYCYKQKHTFIQFIISTTCYQNRQKISTAIYFIIFVDTVITCVPSTKSKKISYEIATKTRTLL